MYSDAKHGIIVRIRQDHVVGDAGEDENVASDQITENNRLSLFVKNMRDDPVAVQARISLVAGATANFELPQDAVETVLTPTL